MRDKSEKVSKAVVRFSSLSTLRFCLQHFGTLELFQEHDRFCRDVSAQAVTLPKHGETMHFSADNKRHRQPYIIS